MITNSKFAVFRLCLDDADKLVTENKRRFRSWMLAGINADVTAAQTAIEHLHFYSAVTRLWFRNVPDLTLLGPAYTSAFIFLPFNICMSDLL